MTQNKQIKNLIISNDGMIQTSQVIELGISKPVLYQYIKENEMEQIAHGVYATKDTWIDFMYLVHLRCEQAVFSHETALFLHDLTDREPMEYEITVKTGYNPSKLNAANNSLLGGGGLVKAVQFLSEYVQGRLSAPGEASNNHSLL